MGIARPTGAIATTTKSIVVRRTAASLQLEEAAEAQRRAFGRARIRCAAGQSRRPYGRCCSEELGLNVQCVSGEAQRRSQHSSDVRFGGYIWGYQEPNGPGKCG